MSIAEDKTAINQIIGIEMDAQTKERKQQRSNDEIRKGKNCPHGHGKL